LGEGPPTSRIALIWREWPAILDLLFVGTLILFAVLACTAILLPVWLLVHAGRPRLAMIVAAGLVVGLVVDRRENWEALSYPHWLLGVPTYFFPVTILAALFGLGVALRGWRAQRAA
jgi:hypothetical protein